MVFWLMKSSIRREEWLVRFVAEINFHTEQRFEMYFGSQESRFQQTVQAVL